MRSVKMLVPVLASYVMLLSSVSGQSLYTQPCPILNLNYPAPSSYASNNETQSAMNALKSRITQALNHSTIYGQLASTSNAFSVDVYSLHDVDPLLTYHYTPNELIAQHSVGVQMVDSNSIYRVGSISKLMTVYVYLIAAGDETWNQPVTKYVPELATYTAMRQELSDNNEVDIVDWDSITVGALASHMSGIIREEAYSPVLEQALQQSLGLSPPTRNQSTFCGNSSVIQIPCDRQAFFENLLEQHPLTASFTTPIYSNIAFQILAYALENITGKPMSDLFNETLVQSLKLNSTYYTVPPSPDTSIIPINASVSLWDIDAREESPAGGYFSSINDLRRIGKSILNSTLLRPAQTRRWMKPHAFTANVNYTVGAPWEIHRAPGEPVSWIYSKTGDIGAYSGIVTLLPEYNVGFTVLSAGSNPTDTVRILSDMVAEDIVPAVYTTSQAAAVAAYTGTYSNATTNSTITVSAPESGPGLLISDWTVNGTSAFPILGSFIGVNQTTQTLQVSLYPSGLTRNNGTIVSWRALFRVVPQSQDPGVFSLNCVSWQTANAFSYGNVGTDEFLFTLDENGNAISTEPRVFGWELIHANRLVSPRSLRRRS